MLDPLNLSVSIFPKCCKAVSCDQVPQNRVFPGRALFLFLPVESLKVCADWLKASAACRKGDVCLFLLSVLVFYLLSLTLLCLLFLDGNETEEPLLS